MDATTSPLDIGIAVPQLVADGEFDPARWQAHLSRVEALGFHSAWTSETILGTGPMLEPLATLAYAAACTARVRLGCAVVLSALRSPVHLAKGLATLDQLSRGRIEVGVGLGRAVPTLGAFGVDRSDMARRFEEGIDLMRACWTRTEISFAGSFWRFEGASLEPKPFQKPHPPLWFGGGARPALRRAARLGDGFIGAGSATTAQYRDQVATVRAELATAGRDPATFRIAKRVYVTVDEDVDRGLARTGAGLARIYHSLALGDLTPVAVVGPPERCVEGLREVVGAGAQLLVLNPLDDEGEQLERLAAEVVPHLGT